MAHHPRIPVHHFTQADIDYSHVWFIQDGSPSSGAFTSGSPMSSPSPSPLWASLTFFHKARQVSPSPVPTCQQWPMTHITYKIMWPLQHGHLLVEDQAAVSFGQEDLNLGKLSYHMTNLTASEDQLQFSLFTSESNLTGHCASECSLCCGSCQTWQLPTERPISWQERTLMLLSLLAGLTVIPNSKWQNPLSTADLYGE